MVVANAVAALSEINEASQSGQPLVGKFGFFLNLIWLSSVKALLTAIVQVILWLGPMVSSVAVFRNTLYG